MRNIFSEGIGLAKNQLGMNGDAFSIKGAKKNVLRRLLLLLKRNSLPEEMFLEYSFCSSKNFRCLYRKGASPLKLGRHREGRREGVELLKDLHRLLKNPPPS